MENCFSLFFDNPGTDNLIGNFSKFISSSELPKTLFSRGIFVHPRKKVLGEIKIYNLISQFCTV